MTPSERRVVLAAIASLKGIGKGDGEDLDDAYMRCALRMLAEVTGLPLEGYRLMRETAVSPKYFSAYLPQSEGDR